MTSYSTSKYPAFSNPNNPASWFPRPTGKASISVDGLKGTPGLKLKRKAGYSNKTAIPLGDPIEKAINKAQSQAEKEATTRTAIDRTSAPTGPLVQPQQGIVLGDSIPVVFGRRRSGGTGGVLVFPAATECAFECTDGITLTFRYHCILGDGEMDSVQVRDFRQGLSRDWSSFSQNYDKRAGTWTPGNRIANLPNVKPSDFPLQCGIGGNYKGVTTLEYTSTCPVDSDRWQRTCSAFVRGGLRVSRIYDNIYGASDNIVDLVKWALIQSGRKKASEFDDAQMLKAATFVEANQLYCNGKFENLTSIPDFLLSILPMFLLRETTVNGKFALAPLVVTNANGTINTNAISPDWTITEEHIIPNSFQVTLADVATTLPLEIAVLWRQQTSEVDPPLDRELLIREDGAEFPTREEFDMRGVCTSEAHAALAGGYRHAVRMIGSDTATVSLARGSQSGYMRQGQILHIFLQVVTDLEASGTLSSYWFIDRVDTTTGGVETLQLSACPVDSQNRSLLALAAVEHRTNAPGMTLPYPPTGVDDVPGRSTDTSVPTPSTSGTPFTEGGGGITGPLSGIAGFNLSRRGNSGGGSGPADPPGTGDVTPIPPGEIPEPGGDPDAENQQVVEQWWNDPLCGSGEVMWVLYRIRGIADMPGGVPLYYDQIGRFKWIAAIGIPPVGGIKMWKVSGQPVNENGNNVGGIFHSQLGDSTSAPFDARGEFRIDYLEHQCKPRQTS